MYIDEGVNDPHIFKAIFMVGGPGAGKTTIAKKLIGGTGLKNVNVDTLYEMLMNKEEKDLGRFDPHTHDRASNLHQKRRGNFISGRLGMVLDGTGRHYDVIEEIKFELESLGYDTAMVFVNTDAETAFKRINNRERKVDKHFHDRTHMKLMQNLGKFQNLFGSDFFIVDNSDPSKTNIQYLSKHVNKFLSKPLSDTAKQWITGK